MTSLKPANLASGIALLVAGFAIGFTLDEVSADKAPPAYLVVSGKVLNAEGLSAYREKAEPLARAAGLEYLARGEVKLLEGQWSHAPALTIEKFDSMAALESFWFSDDYQAAIKLREGHYSANFIVAIEGL